MTAFTATWNIPYAQGTDRLCDGDDITAQMALRVDAIMSAFDTDIDFLANPPAARMQFNVAATQAQFAGTSSPFGLFFDSVDYDTDGMTNLAVDPSTITYRRAGYYAFGGSATFIIPPQTAGCSYNVKIFSLVPVSGVCGQSTRDSNDTAEMSVSALNRVDAAHLVPGNEAEIDMEVTRTGTSNANPIQISTFTNMYAHWIADL